MCRNFVFCILKSTPLKCKSGLRLDIFCTEKCAAPEIVLHRFFVENGEGFARTIQTQYQITENQHNLDY